MPARNNAPITQQQINRYKQRAKALKKESGITHAEALDIIAREEGFSSWKELTHESEVEEDSDEDTDELDFLEEDLPPVIAPSRVAENKAYLAKLGIEYAVFIPTPTAFKKSIIDATAPVRTLFELSDFHFYANQGQGPENRVRTAAVLLSPNRSHNVKVSLYRPKTKKGDPRMWFRFLRLISEPFDEIAIIIFERTPYLINISQIRLPEGDPFSPIGQFLNRCIQRSKLVSDELLQLLTILAKKPIPSIGHGDTAIGMAIEAALGILPNSSKSPDYKGIEIKSGRGRKTRTTLFAQVPIWQFSGCKSSGEILESYGYMRGTRKKLYCTVSTQKPNSQGLFFAYNPKTDQLEELDQQKNMVALWTGDLLRARLREKHAETFWIDANSTTLNGKEYFQLKSVTHTRLPIVAQLMPLIESGVITMDHLISRDDHHGVGVKEKGPLFKINKYHLNLLFPEPITYLFD